jgi:hypothetical protein
MVALVVHLQAVQDAAQGAMVLISEAAFRQCGVEVLRQRGILVVHMGEHDLKVGASHITHFVVCVTLSHSTFHLGAHGRA